jgi:arylformamidase
VAQVLAPDPDGAFALPDVKSAVPISGVYDLEPMRLCFLQETLQLTPEEARRYSAVLNPPAVKVPFSILYGVEESEEFARQSDAFAGACRQRGIPSTVRALAGRHHMSILTAATEKGSEVAAVLLDAMGLQ